MAPIAYDLPVRNFIAGLNRTGHVTHTKHRKTSVTLHHNAGRLSLQGILDVWKTRPASAHFQVDGAGRIGQYVNVNEYAWATGTTKGNQQSISIEMANSAVGGNWPVAAATWHNAARLAAWLHWKVIGHAPNRESLKMHRDWKATACPGTYIAQNYNKILQLSRWWYNQYRTGKVGRKAPVKKPVVNRGAPVTKVPPTKKAPAHSTPPKRLTVGQIASQVLAGTWGNGEIRKQRLERAGYNYREVQDEVNRRIRRGAPRH